MPQAVQKSLQLSWTALPAGSCAVFRALKVLMAAYLVALTPFFYPTSSSHWPAKHTVELNFIEYCLQRPLIWHHWWGKRQCRKMPWHQKRLGFQISERSVLILLLSTKGNGSRQSGDCSTGTAEVSDSNKRVKSTNWNGKGGPMVHVQSGIGELCSMLTARDKKKLLLRNEITSNSFQLSLISRGKRLLSPLRFLFERKAEINWMKWGGRTKLMWALCIQ